MYIPMFQNFCFCFVVVSLKSTSYFVHVFNVSKKLKLVFHGLCEIKTYRKKSYVGKHEFFFKDVKIKVSNIFIVQTIIQCSAKV